jgi:hypothetical protein
LTAQHLVEIFDAPGWIDDSFRTGWSVTSGGGTLVNAGTIAGDYATLTPTSGSPVQVAFSKTLSPTLSSDTYTKLRIRARGTHADAQVAVILWFTGGGGSQTAIPYYKPGTSWTTKEATITTGKNIGTVQIWGKSYASEWDYVIIAKATPPDLSERIEEIDVDLQTTTGVSGFRLRLLNDPALSGVDVGGIVLIYLAGDGETLAEKIIKGRIIDRERGGEPDNPWMEIVGESMDELLLERTYTDEFASATQISAIASDVLLDQFPEFTRSSIDTTNITIKNRFDEERAFEVLKRLAETATFATGEKGANFWVDPGDDFHFEKLGKWLASFNLDDGSGGGAKNILSISVKETMKGNPRLANDIKIIWFEAEYEPKNQDSLTDVGPDQTDFPNWECHSEDPGTPEDPHFLGPSAEYTDIKCGNASVEVFMVNPGTWLTLECFLPAAIDINTFSRLRLWLKRTSGVMINPTGLNFYLYSPWWGEYQLLGNAPPDVDVWSDQNRSLSSFSAVNNPSKWVKSVKIEIVGETGLGVGYLRIDKLRFERDEKAATASDSTSQGKYGRRKLTKVVKTIKTDDFAQKAVNGMLEQLKRPLVTVQVKTKGKAQVGFRPPQQVTVYSVKDGLNGAVFQLVSAKHRYVPEDVYTCDLELTAARNHDTTLEPEVMPTVPPDYLGGYLTVYRRELEEQQLGMRERDYQP